MKRGATIRRETSEGFSVERRMITRHYLLELWDVRCIGCDICALACPKEAIEPQPGAVQNGDLDRKPTVDIDPAKCKRHWSIMGRLWMHWILAIGKRRRTFLGKPSSRILGLTWPERAVRAAPPLRHRAWRNFGLFQILSLSRCSKLPYP